MVGPPAMLAITSPGGRSVTTPATRPGCPCRPPRCSMRGHDIVIHEFQTREIDLVANCPRVPESVYAPGSQDSPNRASRNAQDAHGVGSGSRERRRERGGKRRKDSQQGYGHDERPIRETARQAMDQDEPGYGANHDTEDG